MKKLRIGVVGLGMGQAHINGYKEHPDAEVVAIALLGLAIPASATSSGAPGSKLARA